MYSRENFQKAREIIENRRRAAEDMAQARNAEVRALSERIREIDEVLTRTGLELFRIACAGGDIEPLKAENQRLVSERRDALESIGLPRDYTDLKCTCSICNDTGYAENGICTCMKELIVKMNIESSGMGNIIKDQSFDNFDLEWYRSEGEEAYERMARNYRIAKGYAESFGKGAKNLLLIGATGTGKTHLSSAIAHSIISRGYDVLYESAQNILNAFQNDQFRRDWRQTEPEADKYLDCELLIIDDLGTEFVTQFSVAALYNLINTRQNRSLSTIISTNLNIDELRATYDNRILSRISGADYTILLFTGRDHRVYG